MDEGANEIMTLPKMGVFKSDHEQTINKFIPHAIEHANTKTMEVDPEHAPQVIGGPKTNIVKLSLLSEQERKPFEKCNNTWNRFFHKEMDRLTRAVGLRI